MGHPLYHCLGNRLIAHLRSEVKDDITDKMTSIETNPLARSRVEQIERDLQSWATKPITFSFDPSGTPLCSMQELARSFAKRSMDLAQSIRSLLEQDRIVPATVVARALIETIGMGCLYLYEMERLIALGDRSRLEERFYRFYAGNKDHSIKPVHVMDAIRHLTKIDDEYVKYLDDKYGVFTSLFKSAVEEGVVDGAQDWKELMSMERNYAFLSEIAHPNGTGTQFLYPDPSKENASVTKLRRRFRSASLTAIWHCSHLLKSLTDSDDLPDRFRAAFLSK